MRESITLRDGVDEYGYFSVLSIDEVSCIVDYLANRARQLYKNISMLFLFPVTRDLLFTNI